MAKKTRPEWMHEGLCYSPDGPLMGYYRGHAGGEWYYRLDIGGEQQKEQPAKSRAACIRAIEKNVRTVKPRT